MRNHRRFALGLPAFALLAIAAISDVQAVDAPSTEKPKADSIAIGEADAAAKDRFRLSDLLPTAWQKRPKMRFHVYTEMTPQGRSRPEPTSTAPLTYFSPEGKYVETGWLVIAGERPPPWPQLREAMQKALAGNSYHLIADDRQRPDLLIVFTYGAFSTDLASLAPPEADLPVTAEELLVYALQDRAALKDVLDRARFIGGARVAEELRLALVFGSVPQLLNGSAGDKVRDIVELAFHPCYFVTATAYDFSGVEKKQKIPLWQTRMTIDTQGVAMDEVLKPLIANTGAYLGRETPEAVIIGKRIDREGRVEVGTPTVVPDKEPKPGPAPGQAVPR
ncbi:MAG: hypothetical protein ABIZ81_05140 [Opitutaceae bacterium]